MKQGGGENRISIGMLSRQQMGDLLHLGKESLKIY